MLYFFKEKVHLMLGTEKVPQVVALKSAHQGKDYEDILVYVFFAYGRSKGNAYLDQPPGDRKMAVIAEHRLFQHITNKGDHLWQYVEDLEAVRGFIDRYLETQYTHLQRLRLVLLEKIEKYTIRLAAQASTYEQEVEADKALELFNRRLEEVEVQILKEKENAQGSLGSMHLFELPDEAKAFYLKINFSI